MSNPESDRNPTADWRKYPKSPNFLGIVIGSSILLLVLLFAAWFLMRTDGHKMMPHGPTATPNALLQPLLHDAAILQAA